MHCISMNSQGNRSIDAGQTGYRTICGDNKAKGHKHAVPPALRYRIYAGNKGRNDMAIDSEQRGCAAPAQIYAGER